VKRGEEAREILEVYDLTGSLRGAAALAGCDHKTVARLVAAREEAGGGLAERARRRPLVDPFAEKIDELVDRSRAQIRADKAHGILVAMGYEGSYRTTRRAVAEAKRRWRQKHGRRTRPWIPQPGLWLQWDYGDGPEVAGTRAVLFCAWLAWSRFRVVVPLRDKTLASVVIGLDRTLRIVGAVPTYALTDNEKTVTVEHVCGIAVRNATIVEVSRHYGLTIQTCEPADPQSKGGSEATVKIAKADLVPTDHNLREKYPDWRALEQACEQFMADVNTRAHRATREAPVFLLEQEHEHMHRLPRLGHTLCFGQTRKVDRQATVSVGEAIYSVPHQLIGERVWVRAESEQLIVVHIDPDQGPREVARHQLTTPGRPSINDQHYPPRPAGALERRPRARSSEEREFLAIGDGAERWLKRAAAEGTSRIRRKMAEAVDLAKLHGTGAVNDALERCASYGRFADGDLASILAHQRQAGGELLLFPARSEDHSLQRSTRSWEVLGR
jgi:transposase